MRQYSCLFLLLVNPFLTGCTAKFTAIEQSFEAALKRPNATPIEPASSIEGLTFLELYGPNFRALLAKGFTTPAPGNNAPDLHTWYSEDKEHFSTQGGRLIALTGIPIPQYNTRLTWKSQTAAGSNIPLASTRKLDLPKLRLFEYSEELTPKPISPKNIKFDSPLLARLEPRATQYRWVTEERSGRYSTLPISIYAFNSSGAPVYGSQCIVANHCYEWLYRNNE